jgi:integrase/recombinase XerD
MLQFTAAKAGLKKRVHPHLFRHSFATWALRRGMNEIQLRDVRGHVDLTMIAATYSHLNQADAYDALSALLKGEE